MKIAIIVSALILLCTIILPAIFTPASASVTLKLYPIDDATVIADRNPDLDDKLRYANTGKFDFLKASYSVFVPFDNSNIESKPFLTFDLSGLSGKWVEKATLHLYTSQVIVTEPRSFSFESVIENWNEDQLTYVNKPLTVIPKDRDEIMISEPETWYQLDVTSLAKENADGLLSLEVYYVQKKGPSIDLITFHSKETSDIDKAPYLEIEFSGSTSRFYENSKSIDIISTSTKVLNPTDDLFIALNVDATPGQDELRKLNTSDLKFIQVSYAVNATGNEQNFITVPFIKFNLTDVQSDNLVSAILKAKPLKISQFSPSYIDLFDFSYSDWNESDVSLLPLTFNNSTRIQNSPSIFDGALYQWDITDSVKKSIGSEYTIAMMFHDRFQNEEEIVSFHSSEADDPKNSIYLEIKSLQESKQESSEGGGCLIATATYGTELAPQVQQLRELRDNTVLSTQSGAAFMESFNQLYYSFSPTIADLERENPAFKETVKLAITPLVSSLAILNYLDIDSEEQMLGYGIGIILLNVGMYVGIPAIVIMGIRKKC